MNYYSEVIGYHANYYKKCDYFLNGNFKKSNDKLWLGNGMYFWDNLANAKFWKKEKIRKAEDSPYPEEYKIIIAKISCENLFDFTDTEMVGTFCNILYLAKQGIDKKRLKKMGVGQIIDLVFNI